MNRQRWLLCLLMWLLALCPEAQAQAHSARRQTPETEGSQRREWRIAGSVTNLQGEPVAGASVQVDAAGGSARAKMVETNLKGEFQASVSPDGNRALRAQIISSKEGYADAWEAVEFEAPGKIQPVQLVLRNDPEDVRQMSLRMLVSTLAPRLKYHRAAGSSSKSESEEGFQQAQALIARERAAEAIPPLQKLAQREPACVECHTLLGLALLARGSWTGATQEIKHAATLDATETEKNRIPWPFLTLGVLETWRGQLRRGAVFHLQALGIDASNALALQELGRVLVMEQRSKTADLYLQKAIQAGAPAEAHFLRAHALLDEAAPEQAEAEMQAYLGDRKSKDLPGELRMEWLRMKNRVAVESKGKVATFVDLPLDELLTRVPELKGLQPAATEDEFAPILRSVREGVQSLFRDFPNTSSLEEITLENLNSAGKARDSIHHKYQYLMLPQFDESGVGIKEFRTDLGGTNAGPQGSAAQHMITEGFASQSLAFHPAYQAGSSFRYLGRQQMGGVTAYAVAFAQKPEKATLLTSFRTRDRATTLLSQGVAWIDPKTYRIIRMRTDLLKPEPDQRLLQLTTHTLFGEVRFEHAKSKLWLPEEVSVTLGWNGRLMRNLHRYSDFELFSVDARVKQKAPEVPKADSAPQ